MATIAGISPQRHPFNKTRTVVIFHNRRSRRHNRVPIGLPEHASMAIHKRKPLSAAALDQYLTEQLHKTAEFEDVRLAAGYRLRAPDAHGCNWSGNVTAIHGMRVPPSARIAAALCPIVKDARARFNLSE
jgi:hypothetical protein